MGKMRKCCIYRRGGLVQKKSYFYWKDIIWIDLNICWIGSETKEGSIATYEDW